MAYFFEDVARIVSTKRPGSRLISEIVVKNNQDDLGNSQIPLRELAGRRASLFVRALIERGVDVRYISGSTEISKNSEVQLYFNIVVTDYQKAVTSPRELTSHERKPGSKVSKPLPRK